MESDVVAQEIKRKEVQLHGPNDLSRVFLVDGTVRRDFNFWTPTVHALLRHLERAGFHSAPRVIGIDESGREVLSFVPGAVPECPRRPWNFRSRRALIEVAQLIRGFHDASVSFAAPIDAQWRGLAGAPTSGDVICHNDLGPFNLVFKRGRPIAIIDWDNASPGSRMWDVACALWRFTPLWGSDAWWGGDWEGNGWKLSLETKASRMQVFLSAYGRDLLPDWASVLDVIEARMRASELTVNARAVAGSPLYEKFRRAGEFTLPDLGWLRHNRVALKGLLKEHRSHERRSAASRS
jgi:hypothetical protein